MEANATPTAGLTITVATIEDDPRYRSGLEALLERSPQFRLAGSFSTPAEALAALVHSARAPPRHGSSC